MKTSNSDILKIVVPIVFTLILQTIGVVSYVSWWASKVDSRVTVLEASFEKATKNSYYKTEAIDRAKFVDHRFLTLEQAVATVSQDLKESVIRIENKIDKYFRHIE